MSGIPKMLNGESILLNAPTGMASSNAERIAGFHATLLASRTASVHRSGWPSAPVLSAE
jgi:hypothetical protein